MFDDTPLTAEQIKTIWQRDPATWTDEEKRQIAIGMQRGFDAVRQAAVAMLEPWHVFFTDLGRRMDGTM